MSHAFKAVASVVLTVLMIVGAMFLTSSPATPAPVAQADEGCVINVVGIKVCGTLVDTPLPEVVTVTGPTITLPPATITLPPRTVTINPNPATVTTTITPVPVRVTETVTAPSQPQATVTATLPGRTTTSTPSNGVPTVTVTETIVERVTRQPDPVSGTIEPDEDEPFFSPKIDFGDDNITAGEAGVGILGALILIALVIGGMWYGFQRGRKSEQSTESDFLRSMLDRSKTE